MPINIDEPHVRQTSAQHRRSSAVSQILRKICDDLNSSSADWDLSTEGGRDFRLIVAADSETRTRAFALAHRVYSRAGLVTGESGLIISPYDAQPQSLTLLALDENGKDAATVSVAVDSTAGLPADEIYHDELNCLRANGRLIAEVTRLAISEEHKRSRHLLVRLFNFVYIYARRVVGADDFVVEVHPRHAAYYNRLLTFTPIGPVRPCPRVQNSLSVLLRLNFTVSDQLIRKSNEPGQCSQNDRSLYPDFYSWLEEGAVAEFLARQHRAMNDEEKAHFNLSACTTTEGVVLQSTPR